MFSSLSQEVCERSEGHNFPRRRPDWQPHHHDHCPSQQEQKIKGKEKMSKIIINVLKTDATRVWNSIDTALNLHIYFIILSLWVMLRLDRTCSDMQTWGRSKYILNIYTIAFKINYFCSARMYYWFKVTKDFYIVTDAVLLNFIFKESWKISITVSTKISSCTIVFNINNNKKCHEHQIRI